MIKEAQPLDVLMLDIMIIFDTRICQIGGNMKFWQGLGGVVPYLLLVLSFQGG